MSIILYTYKIYWGTFILKIIFLIVYKLCLVYKPLWIRVYEYDSRVNVNKWINKSVSATTITYLVTTFMVLLNWRKEFLGFRFDLRLVLISIFPGPLRVLYIYDAFYTKITRKQFSRVPINYWNKSELDSRVPFQVGRLDYYLSDNFICVGAQSPRPISTRGSGLNQHKD